MQVQIAAASAAVDRCELASSRSCTVVAVHCTYSASTGSKLSRLLADMVGKPRKTA